MAQPASHSNSRRPRAPRRAAPAVPRSAPQSGPRSTPRSAQPPHRPLALVTGGGRRLGRQIALALGEAGFDVAIHAYGSHAPAEEVAGAVRAAGGRAAVFRADLRVAAQAEALAPQVERTMGPIDLLVNNAAVFPAAGLLASDAPVFDDTIAVNLRAPYLLSLQCGRAMRARGGGAIVNIASVGGLRPYAQHIPYSLSKAGIVMLTRVMALALAPQVRVNAVAPGTLWIPGEERGAAAKPPRSSIPRAVYGTPDDVAQAVLFLARAPFVTGQVLAVDGGSSIRFVHP
jgi:pteridine reductase